MSDAIPNTGEQGTLSLAVTIKGRGFKTGANAKFFKAGTTDPAGVNVKSTQFISSTELLAGRKVLFDFSRPVVNEQPGLWCPEACPKQPSQAPPDFAADPIVSVSLQDAPHYASPNYDFLMPMVCESGWENGQCPNDIQFTIKTAARKQYRLLFSPNLWRSLTGSNTLRGLGAVAVAYNAAPDDWTLSPLLPRTVGGVWREEPCPVLAERLDHVKGAITWVFLGCYDMPFEMKLTKR